MLKPIQKISSVLHTYANISWATRIEKGSFHWCAILQSIRLTLFVKSVVIASSSELTSLGAPNRVCT